MANLIVLSEVRSPYHSLSTRITYLFCVIEPSIRIIQLISIAGNESHNRAVSLDSDMSDCNFIVDKLGLDHFPPLQHANSSSGKFSLGTNS